MGAAARPDWFCGGALPPQDFEDKGAKGRIRAREDDENDTIKVKRTTNQKEFCKMCNIKY